MMAEGDDGLDPWGSGSLEEGDESEYGRQVPPAAVTPPPSIHRGGRFATRSQEDDHELDNDDDDEDDDEDDYHRHGTVHGSGGGDSRSQGTASTLAPEDVELLSEHLATVKLKAEERVFSLNSQLRDLRRKLAASEKKNMEMHHKLYLQSPQLAPHRLDFGEEEEMLNEGSDNGVNVDRDGNESDGSNTMSNGTPTASSDDPILIAWEQGNRDFAEGNFEGGVRHYTIAARMLAANHAAAETRVSELESELEEIDAERTLFASRDMASRDELDQAHQERDRAQEERDEALAAVQELREHHESALQDIVRLQNQVEGEQTRAATAVEELEARVKSLQEELDQVYASNSETEARMRADLSEQLTNARNAALHEIEPELETLREKLRAQENEAQEASQQRNELEAQLADAGHLRTQIEELQSNLRSAEDRCNSLAQDLESKDTQNNQLEAEIARLRETLEQETARISNNQSREEDLAQLRIQLEDAQNLEADARSQISLLEDQERDLYTRVEELEAENKELEGKFTEKTGQLKQLLRKTKARKEAMEKQSQQIALLEAERDEADAKIKAVEENLRAAQDDNNHHVSALQDARMEIESMEARAASLKTRLQAAEAALQEAQQHVSTRDETGHRAESELAAMQGSHDRKIGDLQAKIEEGRSACLAEEVRANDAERRATESATKLEEAHKDVERLRIAESSLHDRIQHLESELAKVTNERDDLDECLQQKQDDVLELEERIAEALQREAALRQGKETKIDQVQPHALSDPFISPFKARDDGAQHDFWQGTSPNQDDGFASPAQGLTSPPTADLNWDSLVTGQGDTGDFAIGEASPSRQDEVQTRLGSSLQDDQLVADLQWRADDADKRAKQLLAELETARSLSENLQEEVARAQASYEETKGDLDVALEQLELERDRNEVLRSQVSDTQQARDQSEAMQHSAFATPGKPVAPQSDEEAVGDVSALFGNSPNEKDFMLDEKSAIASDFFGVHHDEDGDAAAAIGGGGADPQSPVAASLFEEGVRGGGANASSPERADDLQQRVSALQNELWATEARHEEDTKALRERIEHLETQTQGESDMNEEHFRDAQASVKRLEGELTQAKHEAKAVQEELLQAAAKIEQLQNVEASVADLQQEVERLRDAEYSVQHLGKDLEELSQERQALQEELDRLRDAESSSQRLEKDLEEALQERQALQEELDRLRDAESTTQRLEKELEEVSQERQELRQTIDKLSEEQRTAQEDASVGLQVAQDQISSLNSEVATLQTERDGLSAEVTQLRRESDARRLAETRASDLNAALENARAQSDGLQADLTEARDALDATKSELASVCAALEEARSSLSSGLADSQSKLAATEAALLETKGELATVTATRDELQASVDELHASMGEVQGRVEELKEELETTKASLFDVEVAKAEAEKALASEQKMGREAVFKAEHAGREALEAEHASKLELENKLAAAEVARSENESQRAALADQVECLEEAKLEWEHEKRTLASDAQEKVSHFEAHIAELQRDLKLSMEMCADLEEKVQETQEAERIRDEIEARDRALVRLSQRTTKLLGLVKRLEQERDRAQEDAAAMYDLRINDELEERGGGLRTRTQSPLRSAASGRSGRVKEVFGSPGVLKASKSLGLEVDEEETENSRSENPASAAEALLHRSGSISSSSACADQADGENAVGGEWDAMYDQLDERLNEYLEKNQSQEARNTALEQGLAEAMQGLAECSDLADVALARREASRDAALEIETLGEKLRIAEQETVSLQARFESSQQQLQYAKEELELARLPVSTPEDINARADEVAGLHEEIGALREEIQRLQGLLTATRMEGDAHEEGDRQTSASQDEVAHLQEEQLRLRNELALAHEQLRAAKAEAREQEEANAELLRTQLKEGSTQTPLASGSAGSAAIAAAAAAADEVQALDEREDGAGWTSENEGEEGDANPISDAEVNDDRLAEALERAAEAEDAVRALEARCAAAESKCEEFSKEPELLKALSAELSDCMALSAQLRPGTAIEESETKDEVDPALDEALRERDEALQRVARLEKQLAMRKSIFGAKSGLVGQSNSVEDRPLSPPTSDLPLSASPMQSPNRVVGADLSEASRPARSLTIPSKRAQQALNEPFGAARSTGEATFVDKMPSSANDGHVGPNVPDSPLVMPWSEKWWDDEPEDLDLDSPDPDALGSSEPPSAVSSGPAFSTVPSPGDSAAAVGAVGLTSPPTSSSMMTSPPLNPPHSAFGSAPDSGHENAREARSNSVRFGDLPAQEWKSVAATSADTPAASGVVPPTSAQEPISGERTGAATLQEQETEQGDGKKKSKRKVTEPRFLSQMFGLGKHRDLVEASMQDDNSDFDEGEMNEARAHAGGHDSSSVSEGNDMSDPFKAAREIRSRSRTFSNLSSRSLARDAYGHGNYPTFEVRQEPTGIIAGQEAEALSLQQQQAQAQAQQPPSSHRASPPMDPVKPMANPQSEGREPGLSTTSEDSIFGMSRSPDQGMLPPSQASPPPLYPVDAAGGWSSPPTGVAEDDLMQDGNAATEWANMLHGTGSNGEDAEGVSASSPRVSMDASAGIVSEEQIASLLAAKAELEGKLEALEHELGTEREARMWRERQVCLAESELEKALVEVEELRAQLEAAAATATAPLGYAKDSGALPVLPAMDAADRDGESRSENSNPVRMRLSIDTGRGPATQDASGVPPFADPGPPPPPMAAASLPPASGGHNSTSMPMPPPPMDVRSEQESMALRAELVQCKQELERAQAEIRRLQSELNAAGEGVGPGLQRLKELLALREKDFDYVTKNLALDVYARSKESPSSIQNGAVAPPSTPRRKAPLHAEQGHATVVYTNSSRVRRVAVWVHNFLLPHVLLVLTTFLVSAGMPPDVMKEVLRLASNVPT